MDASEISLMKRVCFFDEQPLALPTLLESPELWLRSKKERALPLVLEYRTEVRRRGVIWKERKATEGKNNETESNQQKDKVGE